MIRADHLTVSFRGPDGVPVDALFDVSLQVKPGQFVAVFGPSGSGKSTLLLALAGLLRPTSGSVFLDGQSVYDLPPARRAYLRHANVGFVFQLFHLVPYLSALENVSVPLILDHVSRRDQLDRARDLLTRLGLGDRLRHRPAQLSVGQRQRVALARALVTNPKLLLADEPTGNLDQTSGNDILQHLSQLHHEGKTVLLVTHDPQAARLADHILNLSAGRLQPPA